MQFHPEATHDIYSYWANHSSLLPKLGVSSDAAVAESVAEDGHVSHDGLALLSAWVATLPSPTH